MQTVASQLLRAIRGHRSQQAFARRLGYKSNPIPRWEASRRFPTASETLRACRVVGIDVDGAIERFHPPAAEAWAEHGLTGWLVALAGAAPRTALADRAGLSWQQIGRVLRGETEPRLPAFLLILEAATGRSADFVAQLVDIDEIPSLRSHIGRVRSVRRLAFDHPWSAPALAMLETLPANTSNAEKQVHLSARLPLPPEAVAALLGHIESSGARDPAVVGSSLTVDVAPTHAEQLALRAHWAEASARRMADVRDTGVTENDLFSFNVLAVSRADLQRIRELQRAFYREVRGIASDSVPEVAALLVVHTAALEDGSRSGSAVPSSDSGTASAP